MTQRLSPAAQAVMDAFTDAACGETYELKGQALQPSTQPTIDPC